MLQIVLIPPGSSDYEEQRRIQGVLDVPLSQQGADEVARMGRELQELGIEALYCSPCEPARQTAEFIATTLGVKVKKLENMQNVDHGLWQGLLIDEVKRKQPKVYRQRQEQPESVCPPGGEKLADATKRVRAALGRLLKKHKKGVIGLVVPEPLASLVRAELVRCQLGDLWQADSQHPTWEVFNVAQPLSAVH
jgi:probable phosphoglycerate mutase